MTRCMFLVTALTGMVLAGPAMAQMSGSLLCQQDAKQVRDYLESRQATLPKEKQQSAMEQLQLYEGQCSDQSDSASAQLTALRKDLGMQPIDPQSAQMPPQQKQQR